MTETWKDNVRSKRQHFLDSFVVKGAKPDEVHDAIAADAVQRYRIAQAPTPRMETISTSQVQKK